MEAPPSYSNLLSEQNIFGAGGRISRNLPSITYIGEKYFLGRWERNEKCAVITNRGSFRGSRRGTWQRRKNLLRKSPGRWNFRQILASLKIEVQRFLKINFGGTEISE